MNVLGFKIWYVDGSMQQSTVWNDLPSDNVIIIMLYYDECFAPGKHYRVVADGCDWYWWDGYRVRSIRSKDSGWQDKPNVNKTLIKRGVMISDDEFKRISTIAMEDLNFND